MSRRTVQRNQLLADGLKALALIEAGQDIGSVLLVVPGSRARLYRAMDAARRDNAQPDNAIPIDALLL